MEASYRSLNGFRLFNFISKFGFRLVTNFPYSFEYRAHRCYERSSVASFEYNLKLRVFKTYLNLGFFLVFFCYFIFNSHRHWLAVWCFVFQFFLCIPKQNREIPGVILQKQKEYFRYLNEKADNGLI